MCQGSDELHQVTIVRNTQSTFLNRGLGRAGADKLVVRDFVGARLGADTCGVKEQIDTRVPF